MATNLDVTSIPITFKTLGGGLNTTAGPLQVADNESTILQNMDLDKFGSATKRNGYVVLNPATLSGTNQGLVWYTSLYDRNLVTVANGKIYKMDSLDGTWDDITGAVDFSSGGVDTDTTLMLHFDGSDQSVVITDSSLATNVITNTETYDSYTVLMLHCDGANGSTGFTDSSLSTKAVTAVNATLSTTWYKFGTASGAFDGSSAYLSLADSADWDILGGAFTLEFWWKTPAGAFGAAYHTFASHFQDATHYWTFRKLDDDSLNFQTNDAGTVRNWITNTGLFATNTLYHIVISYDGTTVRMFINGVLQTLATNNAWQSFTLTGPLYIGTYNTGLHWLNGYIDEYRLSKGICRVVSNFTLPATPFGIARLTTDTNFTKFGTAGVELKGYERLQIADSANWNFAEQPFTIDTWTKFNVLAGSQNNYQMIYQQESGAGNKVLLWLDSGTHLKFLAINSNTTVADYAVSWSPLAGSWDHIAVQRTGTTFNVFINGTSQTATAITAIAGNTLPNLAANVYIGGDAVNTRYFMNGWLDEYRISTGVARYTTNFTPKTIAYSDREGGFAQHDFEVFRGYLLGTSQGNTPWQWSNQNSTATNMTLISGSDLSAKFVKEFQNYTILGNIRLNSVDYSSRIYWSAIRSISSWDSADWMELGSDDGDEMTGLRVLGDRLCIYKNSSIYVIFFTGDSNAPFTFQKSNSPVGCIAPQSIQEVENGHVFLAVDGIYFFDGFNSYKMSDRINDTFAGLNGDYLNQATSIYYRKKNLYILACPSGTSLYNDFIITWNSYLNAWATYTGISSASMAVALVRGVEERPYFGDYLGYIYRLDIGTDDYPSNSIKAIETSYYTNWKHYDDLCDNKGIPHLYLTHRNESSTTLQLRYSYDFYNGDQYTQTFSLYTTQTVTSLTTRRDLTGRGKFVRFGFYNNQTGTSFRLDGIGTYVSKESKS